MARQLKRWESPRREGRNAKGRGGSARQRQIIKQQQQLRRKLKKTKDARDAKTSTQPPSQSPDTKTPPQREPQILSFFVLTGKKAA
jgi:hypothetical protein